MLIFYLYCTFFFSQHLKLLFKLIIQLVLLHDQFMWNGRYAFVKNNDKCGEDILGNQGDLRYFKFVCILQALMYYNSLMWWLKNIDIILNVTLD